MAIFRRNLTTLKQTIQFEYNLFNNKLNTLSNLADLSIFHEFIPPPIGGGHQFLRALWRAAETFDLKVENNSLSKTTRACLLNSFNFDIHLFKRLRRKSILYIHRVDGPIDVYRGSNDGVDKNIWQNNQLYADKTIFQSQYSLEKHLELGMEFRNTVVIPNAADPKIFNQKDHIAFSTDRKVRLIASSWSNNYNKGALDYQWLDEHLDWNRYEFTFVGRSPIPFKNIEIIPPVDSEQMANLFRKHDIYITASKYDPCSNSLIEALSCGLPAIYLNSGGHPELAKEAGFSYNLADEIPALLTELINNYDYRKKKIAIPTLQEVCLKYLQTLELV